MAHDHTARIRASLDQHIHDRTGGVDVNTGMNQNRDSRRLLSVSARPKHLRLHVAHRPEVPDLADYSRSDSGVAHADGDIADYLLGDFRLAGVAHLRRVCERNVVAAAHDDIQTRGS